MRRLFSTFAHGPPGVGILILRVAAGLPPLVEGIQALVPGPPSGSILLHAGSVGVGLLLLAGLWTPFAGALLVLQALWSAHSSGYPLPWILLAALGAALTLIGPGAWSVDAWLFGWKRLEIPGQKGRDSRPLE